jgi:hypothetical protein
MVKIKINGIQGKDKFILINPECIVSVEESGYDNYNLYLTDGRVLRMTTEMYEDNFDEEEDDQEDDEASRGVTI